MGNLCKLPDGGKFDPEKIGAPIKVKAILALLEEKYKVTIRRDSTLILVNGVEVNALDDLETLVLEGDQVSLVPMFHGG